ncbi:MAG: hypothetical protein AMJ79_15595 [Phycisphaerae bacterium SM23_30]|nr:MAG: hypothetical protein AMJ79_15595 [Phycisphaerae bacterium SM23_30]
MLFLPDELAELLTIFSLDTYHTSGYNTGMYYILAFYMCIGVGELILIILVTALIVLLWSRRKK